MSVYDDEEMQGLGTPAGPGFSRVAPTYNADPSAASSEKSGNDPADSSLNSATKNEQSALDSQNRGGFLKGGLESLKGFGENTKTGAALSAEGGLSLFPIPNRRRATAMLAGLVLMIIFFIVVILGTFNVPAATIRAVGDGLLNAYGGAQIAAGNAHWGNYWDGKIGKGFKQVCTGSTCVVEAEGKTKLWKYSARAKTNLIADLAEKGVKINLKNGSFDGFTIDMTKPNSPYLDAVNDKDNATALRDRLRRVTGTTDINVIGTADNMRVTSAGLGRKTGLGENKLFSTVIADAAPVSGDGFFGKFATKISIRSLKSTLDLGFHPLSKLANATNDWEDRGVAKAAKWFDEFKNKTTPKIEEPTITGTAPAKDENGKPVTSTASSTASKSNFFEKFTAAKGDINKFLGTGPGRITGGAVAIAGALCIAGAILNGASQMSTDNLVDPASRLANSLVAASEQTKAVATPDVDSLGIQAPITSLLEKRMPDGSIQSFKDSEFAHQILFGKGGGVPLADTYAVIAGYPVRNKDAGTDKVLQALKDLVTGGAYAAMCEGPGSVAMAGIGIGLSLGSGFIFTAVSTALAMMVLPSAIQFISSLAAGAPLDVQKVMKEEGPAQLFNIASAVGMANTYRLLPFTSGGDPISGPDFVKQSQQHTWSLEQDFRSKSIAYRLFNSNDSLSLANKVALNMTSDITYNISGMMRSFTNIIQDSFKSFGSIFSPKASAYSKFDPCSGNKHGCFGLSNSTMSDDGSGAEAILDATDPSKLTDISTLPGKMFNCRDVEFYKDADGDWTTKINPDLTAYKNFLSGKLDPACDYEKALSKNPGWAKLQSYRNLEVHQATTTCISAKADSTDPTDSQACAVIGYGNSTPTSTGGGGIGTSKPKTMSELMVNSASMDCPAGTEDFKTVQTKSKLLDGKNVATYNIKLCLIKEIKSTSKWDVNQNSPGGIIVNAVVAQQFLDLAKWAQAQAKSKNLSPFTVGYSFRTNALQVAVQGPNAAPPYQSAHEMGLAVDIGQIGRNGGQKKGATCASGSRALPTSGQSYWDILNGSTGSPGAQQFGIYQISTEPWHWDARPTSCTQPY